MQFMTGFIPPHSWASVLRTISALAVMLLCAPACENANRPPQHSAATSSDTGEPTTPVNPSTGQNLVAPPTPTDVIRLQTLAAGMHLGRVTATAKVYSLGYHAGNAFTDPADQAVDDKFFAGLWAGQYDQIDELTGLYTQRLAAQANPHPTTLARLGFLNAWKFAERYRLLEKGQTFPAELQGQLGTSLGACSHYFGQATLAAPNNSVYKGFSAVCDILMGQAPNSEASVLNGLLTAAEAIKRNPTFNLFTIGYALTFMEPTSDQFKLGLEMMFRNLDVCFMAPVSRTKPDVSGLIKSFRSNGDIRDFCLNSKKAPYNFEGFFMILGDLMIKQGNSTGALTAYANAKLLPSYFTWPYRAALDARILAAKDLVTPFQAPVDPMRRPEYPTITFNTEYSCMVCHQKSGSEP